MNKTVIAIVVAVIVLIGIGAIVVRSNDDKSQDTTTQTTQTTPVTPPAEDNQDSTVTPTPPPSTVDASTSSVTISNFAFEPQKITVKKGTTITWTNKDSTQHTVTPDTETADFASSQLLSEGATYSVTFTTAGTYTYHCTPHPQMTGTVEVTE